MLRKMCKSKIQNAVVTGRNVNYSGSIRIDSVLLEKADILPHEMVLVVNLANGERFETYAIESARNSGEIGLQGGAALLGKAGDRLIIMSYCYMEDKKAKKLKQKLVLLDSKNRIIKNQTG